jgi:peroxiredoxin
MSDRDALQPFALPDLTAEDGRPVSIASLADSHNFVVLAVFKTTCPVCQLSWPYVERLHRSYHEVAKVVGVSQDGPADSREYHEQFGNARFDLLYDRAPQYRFSNALGIVTVPHVVAFDRSGGLLSTWQGWQRDKIELLAQTIAAYTNMTLVPLIAASDPVPASKAG